MNEADIFEARWKGTIELDTEAVEVMSLDGLAFAVVAFRVEEMGGTKITRDGRKRRKDVFNVEDARALVGNLRDEAVQFLAGHPMSLSELSEDDLELGADDELAESQVSTEPIQEPSGVVMHALDYKKTAKAEASGRDGVKVGKFSADDLPVPTAGGDVEQLGSIHPDGYKGKDKILRRFLES